MVEKFNTGETPIELKKKYNPEGSVLRKCQLRMLDMLIYIDRVCKEQNIKWRLDGGNVLGAVRHGGFIPWDDDVDIVLSHKNYIKLCKYLKAHPHHQYVLQDNDTDKGYYNPGGAVLRDLKSEYVQDDIQHNIRKYRGMQIDIFPYENHVNPWLARRIMQMRAWNRKYFIGKHPVFAQIMYKFIENIAIPCCKIVGYPISSSTLYGHSYGRYWKFIPEDLILPYKPILFEGFFFPAPAKPVDYCEFCFPNYLNLPAKEKRNHHKAKYIIWD